MRKITLLIANMYCGAGLRQLSQALQQAGAVVEEVRIGAARVQAPDDLTDAALLRALEKAGYHALLYSEPKLAGA
jgi:hypothetical protein